MADRHPHHRGDVMLVSLRFSGATGQKDRPVVVVSTDAYHDAWDELLAVALTTQTPRLPHLTDYLLKDWQIIGLRQPSWSRSGIAIVDRRLIFAPVGRLTDRDLAGLEACLRIATDL